LHKKIAGCVGVQVDWADEWGICHLRLAHFLTYCYPYRCIENCEGNLCFQGAIKENNPGNLSLGNSTAHPPSQKAVIVKDYILSMTY
jgi:hypothetical protein